MSKPKFVAISDIHFNVNNLELATYALNAAINKAEYLKVTLVIAGDLLDTKAIIRGEVANRLIKILEYHSLLPIFILPGNHDLINEKGDENSLNFLNNVASVLVVSKPELYHSIYFIPYQNTNEKFKAALCKTPKNCIVVCHQGVQGAFMGDYVQDKSSVSIEELGSTPIISGHYHRHQTIGPLTYIGSPFTHTFGEANDGPKGFLIVNEDGTFTREILDLRKHVKINASIYDKEVIYHEPASVKSLKPTDLVWVKILGTKSRLDSINKEAVGKSLLGHSNFKLDLVPLESNIVKSEELIKLEPNEILDNLIDATKESKEQKDKLKELYRSLL